MTLSTGFLEDMAALSPLQKLQRNCQRQSPDWQQAECICKYLPGPRRCLAYFPMVSKQAGQLWMQKASSLIWFEL
jgi:hypothetical protein